MADIKKTLYHSELVRNSPVTLTVIKGPLASTKKRGTFYVVVEYDGVERQYSCENEGCAKAFEGYEGCTLTLDANGGGKGKEDTASIEIDADSVERGGKPAAPRQSPARSNKPAPAARRTEAHEEPPPSDDPPTHHEPPAAKAAPLTIKQRALQIANLQLVALAAARAGAAQAVTQLGWQPTDEQIANNAMNIVIQLEHEKAYWEMPASKWVDVRPSNPAPAPAPAGE